ncbi:MAG: hypothetical protein A2271_02250 [Candidatus Moranbacteria bacterium RIFOXYA12_FULL_35_19]|nr:MAG: hypothetical protein UR78_C0008G0001 [Candidatus Moranbacteria bacterium GW2011_GWF2_35_39]OGI32045.1 MAG: hypothetical protein A2343_02400 [Candidatus Moranbacteria bacterium RIFOXYB12_FULL_35_8]OGI35362.1 MAG: hypothetical protein A2271_02250 [Candidatus Moranbacteria bacterium RIFOXYA12_FULL_35_19]
MLDKKLKEALELLGGRAVIKDQEQYYVVLSLAEFKKIKKEGIEGSIFQSKNVPRNRFYNSGYF